MPVAFSMCTMSSVARLPTEPMVVGVAVRHRKPEEGDGVPEIVSPCGACRELLMDYAPDALVIVPSATGPAKRPVRDMLPLPYRR